MQKSRLLSHLLGPSATSQPSLPPLSALSKSSQGEHEDSPCIPPRGTREKADLFSHTAQSIFPSIPFHSAAIQVCSAQLFSLKYPTLQRERKKILSAAVTQAKNNPFLVNKIRVSLPSPRQHSICSFLCFICSKCENAKEVSTEMGCCTARGSGIPGGAEPGGSAQPPGHTLGRW